MTQCRRCPIQKALQPFTDERILLAVSGGADSLAMYCAAQSLFSQLFIVHIDHGWRESSAAEAQWLKKNLRGTLHLERIGAEGENQARQSRLAIYRRLCDAHDYSGVLLAHHADDQAEVVFKRAIEGAGLVRLAGMRSERIVEGVRLLRPFLHLSRSELRRACTLPHFEDPTNSDPYYFRAKLRKTIFPALGRGVRRPLIQLAQEARELEEYLAKRMPSVHRGPWGWWADLRQLERIERRHFLRRCGLSRQQLDSALDLATKQVGPLHIDRGRVFHIEVGGWEVRMVDAPSSPQAGWAALLGGEARVSLPTGHYRVEPPDLAQIGRRLTAHKVPKFLRRRIPVVWQGDRIVADFLTPPKTFASASVTVTLVCVRSLLKKPEPQPMIQLRG